MVRDTPARVVSESVRRQIDQVVNELAIELPDDCPVQHAVGPERMKRLLGLNIVMARIIQLSSWN